MDLDFRKYLMEFGITSEEFKGMEQPKKQELIDRYNKENGITVGKVVEAGVSLVVMIPALVFILLFAYVLFFG